jgi:hypothetical protein
MWTKPQTTRYEIVKTRMGPLSFLSPADAPGRKKERGYRASHATEADEGCRISTARPPEAHLATSLQDLCVELHAHT